MMNSLRSSCVAIVVLAAITFAARADAQPYVYTLGGERYPEITSQRLLVLNAATNTFVAGVRLGRRQSTFPENLAIAPDAARVYAVNSLDYTISVVSTQTNTVVATWTSALVPNPHGVTVSADSRRVFVTGTEYVTNRFVASLYVVDAASATRLAAIPLGFEFAYGIALSPDGLTAYVLTGTSADALAVVRLDTSAVTTIPIPGSRVGFQPTVSPDGRYVYLTRYNGSGMPASVQVVDTASRTIVATTPVGIGGRHVAVSPDGATIYASGWDSNGAIHRLNPATHASDGAIPAPYTGNVAFLPDSRRAYVTGGFNGESLYVVDTATHAVLGSVPVPVNVAGGNTYGGVAAVVATPPAASVPGSTPTNLAATIIGNRVTLTWSAATSVSPTGYAIEGGFAPGQVIANIPTGSTATTITLDVPAGVYYVRVRALTASGPSGPSNEIRIAVNQPQPPAAPTALLGLADGSTLALSWTLPATGGPPTSLQLDVSGALNTSVSLPVSDTFSFAGVPPGTYTFALRAANAAMISPASAPVTLTFPGVCAGPPETPTQFAVSRQGSQLSISWSPPTAGPAVSSYVLRATGAVNVALPMSVRSISGTVAAGTYGLSVQAVNSCGAGGETAVQTVTVP